jgi:hypothetical protein
MRLSCWESAYRYALSSAKVHNYRYSVRADRARPGMWLVARIPGSAGMIR